MRGGIKFNRSLGDIPWPSLEPTQKQFVVYTAVTNNYNKIREPFKHSENVEFVCFTDDKSLNAPGWKTVEIPFTHRDPRRTAKLMKILPHKFFKNYQASVYVDAKCQIIGDMEEFILDYVNDLYPVIAMFSHPRRNCIYKEGSAVVRSGKENYGVVRKQLKKYKKAGYPTNNGLHEGAIILRNHNDPTIQSLMEDWASEIENHSARDQLSLPYIAWKHKFPVTTLPLRYQDNEFFKVREHDKLIVYSNSGKPKTTLRARAINYIVKVKKRLN